MTSKVMHYPIVLVILIWISSVRTSADFKKEALALHNQYRAKHRAPPLILNDALNKYAQNWAQEMAKRNKLVHSDTNYGENIYYTSDTRMSDADAVKEATKLWYNEVSDYNFKNPGFGMSTGHFSQIVWKNSQYFGIGVSRSSSGVYVCGTYDPPGNYEGEYRENVFQAK